MLSPKTVNRQLWTEQGDGASCSQEFGFFSVPLVCFSVALLMSFCYVVCCCFIMDKALICVYFFIVVHFSVCQNVWDPSDSYTNIHLHCWKESADGL